MMGSGTDYKRELGRKVFHLLSLVYLGGYHVLGRTGVLWVLGAWIVLEGALELVRLRHAAFNARLMRLFGGIHREGEERRISGIFWTSLGCWLTLLLFGARPRVVAAAILFLALGDGFAALVGKGVGRVQIGLLGRRKTLEGSLACLSACLAAGWAVGIRGPGLLAGAMAATLVEFLPVPIDDNFWLPVISAAAITLAL